MFCPECCQIDDNETHKYNQGTNRKKAEAIRIGLNWYEKALTWPHCSIMFCLILCYSRIKIYKLD